MDQRDEFTKWMEAVEEALKAEGKAELAENMPQSAECGCGSWDCPVCFPMQNELPGMNGSLDGIGGVQQGMGGLQPNIGAVQPSGMAAALKPDAVVIGIPNGEQPKMGTRCPVCGSETNSPGMHNHDYAPDTSLEPDNDVGMFANLEEIDIEGAEDGGELEIDDTETDGTEMFDDSLEVEEEENTFVEKPRSGKGVKLGNIVTKTEVRPTDGHNSPETYGSDNLLSQPRPPRQRDDVEPGPNSPQFSGQNSPLTDVDERESVVSQNPDDYGKAGRYSQDTFGNLEEEGEVEERADMVETIMSMQQEGQSHAQTNYSPMDLMGLSIEQLRECYEEVTGGVSEMNHYGPGTAPTMPEGVMMEADKDVMRMLGALKWYDVLAEKKGKPDFLKKKDEEEGDDEKEEIDEAKKKKAKPDFPDIDKDKNKKESIKKAAEDKKKKGIKESEEEDDEEEVDEAKSAGYDVKKSVKEDVEGPDPEVLEWMARFSKLGRMG